MILRSLLQDEQAETRRTAAESLGKIGDPADLMALLPLVHDLSPLVRSAAIQAIGRLGSGGRNEAVTAVLLAIKDGSESVRRSAVEALEELDPPPAALESLISLLDSSDVHIRKAILLALLSTDTSAWVDRLKTALQDGDGEIRQRAAAVLGEIGSPIALDQLGTVVLRDPNPAVRVEAAYRLRHVPAEEARRLLGRVAVEDRDEDVRRWAKE
jgi:HEAT repeat protein